MHTTFAFIALIAHVLTIGRILVAPRFPAPHCYRVAWTTWLILAVSGGSAVEVLMRLHTVGFFRAALAAVLAVIVWLARGNIERLRRACAF